MRSRFLTLDLSRAVLSPKPLGPPAQFQPLPVQAKTDFESKVVKAEPVHVDPFPRHVNAMRKSAAKVAIVLEQVPLEETILVDDIADKSGVPRRKARIVLVLLKRHGLVREYRGGSWARLRDKYEKDEECCGMKMAPGTTTGTATSSAKATTGY